MIVSLHLGKVLGNTRKTRGMFLLQHFGKRIPSSSNLCLNRVNTFTTVHYPLNPRNGVVFGKVFGTEYNKNNLVKFLNDVLEPQSKIVDLKSLEVERKFMNASNAVSWMDIYCETNGEPIAIEIQVLPQPSEEALARRFMYYLSLLYCSQPHNKIAKQMKEEKEKTRKKRIDSYYPLKKSILVLITDFKFPNTPTQDFLSKYSFLNKKYLKDETFSFMELVLIELPKFDPDKTVQVKTIRSELEKWCYFLKYADIDDRQEQIKDLVESDKVLQNVYNTLCDPQTFESLSFQQQIKYAGENITSLIKEKIMNADVEDLGRMYVEHVKMEKIQTAKALLAEGVSVEVLLKGTGLNKADLE